MIKGRISLKLALEEERVTFVDAMTIMLQDILPGRTLNIYLWCFLVNEGKDVDLKIYGL